MCPTNREYSIIIQTVNTLYNRTLRRAHSHSMSQTISDLKARDTISVRATYDVSGQISACITQLNYPDADAGVTFAPAFPVIYNGDEERVELAQTLTDGPLLTGDVGMQLLFKHLKKHKRVIVAQNCTGYEVYKLYKEPVVSVDPTKPRKVRRRTRRMDFSPDEKSYLTILYDAEPSNATPYSAYYNGILKTMNQSRLEKYILDIVSREHTFTTFDLHATA